MLFEYMDHEKDEEGARRTRAVIASNQRVADMCGGYLKNSASEAEFEERVSLLEGAIQHVVKSACEDHESEPETVLPFVMANLKYVSFTPFPASGAPGSCPNCGGPMQGGKCQNCGMGDDPSMGQATPVSNASANDPTNPMYAATTAGGHKPGCTCGFCENKGKGFGGDDEAEVEDDDNDESSEHESKRHVAVDVETGDTFTQETVSLPTAGEAGLGSEASPKIDKADVPKAGLSPVDIPSKEHPLEHQDVEAGPDYNYDTQGAHSGDSDPTKYPRKQVDADSPMQPAEWAAPRTKTFPNSGQADPVTQTALSKWQVTDGIS